MNKPITEYKAIVFDLDGTLYYQRRLRIKMAWMLGSYYLCHFWRVKELFIVKKFREVRENWETISQTDENGSDVHGCTLNKPELSLEEKQYKYVAKVMNCSADQVKNTVVMWIYDKPLKAVAETADRELISIIEKLKQEGRKIFIFSDYPIEDKLKALSLSVDGMYAATDERLNELKPSPKGLNLIMEDHAIKSDDILMVGDRMSRDGEAAVNAGCDYIILPKSSGERRKLYDISFKV